MNKNKPNCYECKFRGGLAGNAHSCCKHPDFASAMDDPLGQILGIFAGVGRISPIQADSTDADIYVKGNPHGIERGWFNHPWNFDPVWLEECTGFESKEKADGNK